MESPRISGAYNMSLTETYLLASKARSKLTREASRQDHDLRVLVSHANMLDNLMDSLAQHRYNKQQQQQQQQTAVVTFAEPASPASYDEDDQELEYVYADDESSDDDESQYSDDEEEDDDEDNDDEYTVFEDIELPSTRIYNSKNKQYKVLPTVDEAPLEEYEYDEDTETTASYPHSLHLQRAAVSQPLIETASTLTPSQTSLSVAVVEVLEDEDEDADDDSSSYTSTPSSPSDAVPSLCYSSEEESDDELYPTLSDSSTEESASQQSQGDAAPAVSEEPAAATVSVVVEPPVKDSALENATAGTQPLSDSVIDVSSSLYSRHRLLSKRLVLPSPEQLDLLVR